MSKRKNKPKLYTCICKIGNNPDGTANCIKHHLNDLLKYVTFLDKKYPTWRWFNVYSNRGAEKREQLGNFTKLRRPLSNRL